MTKSAPTSKTTRKQYTPEFRDEALKLGVLASLPLLANSVCMSHSSMPAWRSKLKNAHSSSEREQEVSVEIARLSGNWLNGMKNWSFSKRPRHTSRSA